MAEKLDCNEHTEGIFFEWEILLLIYPGFWTDRINWFVHSRPKLAIYNVTSSARARDRVDIVSIPDQCTLDLKQEASYHSLNMELLALKFACYSMYRLGRYSLELMIR